VWGLDQEFIGSARFLLAELEAAVEADENAVRQVRAWQDTAREGFAVFAASGDSSRGFLNVIDPVELAAFAGRLPNEARRARRIVEELRQSALVYQHYAAGRYYENNHDRIRLMKRHLAEYLAAAGGLERAPKVLFKLGSAHAGRGYSPFHQLDVGNAAAELAAARLGDSFHLNVLTVRSVGRDGKEKDWTEEAPYLARFAGHASGSEWSVFDLRALRPYFAAERSREAHPDLAEIVFRFDALALAPAFSAATPMIPLPF